MVLRHKSRYGVAFLVYKRSIEIRHTKFYVRLLEKQIIYELSELCSYRTSGESVESKTKTRHYLSSDCYAMQHINTHTLRAAN